VISHGHYDHCDLAAFAAYPDKTVPFAVARGLANQVRAAGFCHLVELDPWQSTHLGPVRVTGPPPNTVSRRSPSYSTTTDKRWSSVADTLRIAELDEVADHFPELDLALLPINGLRIRPAFNRQVVMDAVEAAELTSVLRPRLAVPIHYAYTAGPIRDRVLLKLDRDRPDHYQQAPEDLAPNKR
jgi:L-ascorbate metabolism protein UlaG (beta-lactamase superfamily)